MKIKPPKLRRLRKLAELALKDFQAGNLQQARHACGEILKIQPDNVQALYISGLVHYQIGEYDLSIENFKQVLRLNPDGAGIRINLGNAFQKKGRLDEAEACYQEALKLDPVLVDGYMNLGAVFGRKGRLVEAISCYRKALELNPYLWDAYYNLGGLLCADRSFDEAIRCYRKAIELNPNSAESYNNLAFILQEKGQVDEAITCYQKVLLLNPNLASAYFNLGTAFRDRSNIGEAVACYRKAIDLDANFVDAHFNLALVLLLSGDYGMGWKEFDWRWEKEDISLHRNLMHPLWDGRDLAGRTILLYAEDGFGDTIQFMRYVPMVSRHSGRIVVECQSELVSVMRNVKGIDSVVTLGEKLPQFDTYCSLLRLPLIFDTTLESIPANVPYVSVEPALVQKWREKIRHDDSKLKVGLAWSGNPRAGKLQNRACSVKHFSVLRTIRGVSFYSLQKGEASKDIRHLAEAVDVVDYTLQLGDFSDTAALMENLDLIISVDTAVAHLAGAMGKPVWTLLSFASDWRWLLNREDSPWYPTMRLFRQPSPGDWTSVMARIVEELHHLS